MLIKYKNNLINYNNVTTIEVYKNVIVIRFLFGEDFLELTFSSVKLAEYTYMNLQLALSKKLEFIDLELI